MSSTKSTKPPFDTDGKIVIKVDPKQVRLSDDGSIVIDNKDLKKFLAKHQIDKDAHVILMGSNCGCQCCC